MKTIYKIWCEWEMPDLPRDTCYTTYDKALKAIHNQDWTDVQSTAEQVLEDGNGTNTRNKI